MADKTSQQDKALTVEKERADKAVKEVELMKRLIIGQVIKKNKIFQNRVLMHAEVEEQLAKHLAVDITGDMIRVKGREPAFIAAKGLSYEPDDVVTELLQSQQYQQYVLREELGADKRQGEDAQGAQRDTKAVSELKRQYKQAKEQGETLAMVSLKRRLAEAGCTDIL